MVATRRHLWSFTKANQNGQNSHGRLIMVRIFCDIASFHSVRSHVDHGVQYDFVTYFSDFLRKIFPLLLAHKNMMLQKLQIGSARFSTGHFIKAHLATVHFQDEDTMPPDFCHWFLTSGRFGRILFFIVIKTIFYSFY